MRREKPNVSGRTRGNRMMPSYPVTRTEPTAIVMRKPIQSGPFAVFIQLFDCEDGDELYTERLAQARKGA